MSETDETPRPLLRVVRGAPAAEELAALVAVLGARPASGASHPAAPRSRWADPARRLLAAEPPRAGAWRGSALPR